MPRLRPLRTRAIVAAASALAALSLLVTSLSPLGAQANAAEETAQSTQVTSSQEEAQASSETDAVSEPAQDNQASTEDPTDNDTESAPTPPEATPEDQPRTRRTRAINDTATLAMSVANDTATLPIRDQQTTTINYSCSSVSTPCEGGTIEVWLPAPLTPAGEQLSDNFYQAYPVAGSSVVTTRNDIVAGTPRMQRILFTLKDPIPAGTSDRIQVPWSYLGNDAPNNSTTTTRVVFSATNAQPVEQSLTTTWTASLDVAINKSGPTQPQDYPAVGGLATYKLYYGYQQIDQSDPNKVGIRWNGSARKSANLNGLGFVQAHNITVSDPLPANAVFVSATNGGHYDAATHTVTWTYEDWAWQNPITSTITVKYPVGAVTTSDTVTNEATITAQAQNDPSTVVTKSSDITHGFSARRPAGSMIKYGNDWQYQTRGNSAQWRLGATNSGNTPLHFRWDDTPPCTWSTQDAKASGGACDTPTMVSPYRFQIHSTSGYEDNGGWTLEYWTNKGNHDSVTYTASSPLTLPDGEWITRFTIDTDALPQTNPTIFFYGTIPTSLPNQEPADFTNHYNPAAPPEQYYNYVASTDYVRYQNCASGTATDIDSGAVIYTNDNLCSWMRVRNDFPSIQIVGSLGTDPVVIGKPAMFALSAYVRPKSAGGVPTPVTMTDLLPLGFDVDDTSTVSVLKNSTLKNPDGTPYDLTKLNTTISKNYNGTGRTLVSIAAPDAVEGNLYVHLTATVLSTTPAGSNSNDAAAFMPGDGAKSTTQDTSLRNAAYCQGSRARDTNDVNRNGSTEDYVCNSSTQFNVSATPGMTITKEAKGNKDDDFVPAGQIAQIDPGGDGAYRFTISNTGNTALTNVVAYDILPYKGDVGVGPAAGQARGSSWKPNLNSTNWSFHSVKHSPGQAPVTTTVPASDITVEYSTVPNPCRGEVMAAGGSMNDSPVGCTRNAWGGAPSDLSTITGFRIVMNRDIEIGETIQFVATMTSPVNANLIAWNSVALAAGSLENNRVSYLQPNEAPKVGINVSTDVAVSESVVRARMNGDQPVRDANGIIEADESTDLIMPGDYMLYRVSLANSGPSVASGITITDAMDDSVEYVSSETRICQDGATNPCTGPVYTDASYDEFNSEWNAIPSGQLNVNLNVGATMTMYMLVRVADGAEGRTVMNTVSLGDFDQVDSDTANNTASATFTVGGSISGTIFNDADATWYYDTGGPGVPLDGVNVRLLDADGHPVKDASGTDITTKSTADGSYVFNRLPMGSYKVEVVPSLATRDGTQVNLADYTLTLAYDSSASRAQAGQGTLLIPNPITLTPAAPTETMVDFGFVKPASLGDYVWFDANRNGIQDADEAGVAGVEVSLADADGQPVLDASGNTVEPVTTDANGKYSFTDLLPNPDRMFAAAGEDHDKVIFTAPAGYSPTVTHAGTDAATDSNGLSSDVALAQGQRDTTVDLGLIADGAIGGTLYWDVNNSGGASPSGPDRPLDGVTLTLTYKTPTGVDKTATTLTDSRGHYSFKDLAPGDYTIIVEEDSVAGACPTCTAQTHAPSGDLTAGQGQELSLTSNVTLTPVDMSNNSQDWAFTSPADTAIAKTITDPSEAEQDTFEFTPGKQVTYTLTLTNNGPGVATGVTVLDHLPSGVSFVGASGDGSYDATSGVWNLSDQVIETSEVKTLAIAVTITGDGAGALVTNVARITHQDQVGDDPTNNEASASFRGGFNIGGTIYRDSDGSYSTAGSEERFTGITVALLNEDGSPVLGDDGVPVTAVTDASGAYRFVDLGRGSYRVSIVDAAQSPLASLVPTQAYTGKGATWATVIISDASVEGVNFGLVAPATIGERVWDDVNANGSDDGEPGIGGVSVILTDADGAQVARTTTDANGNYRFAGLIPGTYTVTIEAPSGYAAATTSMSVRVGEGEEYVDADFPLTLVPAATPAQAHQVLTNRGLARTGTDATIIGGMAALAAIAGALAIGAKRRREREDA